MQDDQFAAAEKILLDIELVFKKDPKLREFDILPMKLNQNKSPVIHSEHCLGLESWCVRHVYCYCYQHLMAARHRREDPAVMARWLLGAALLNPDNPAFWHGRKRLVRAGRLQPGAELRLAAVALSRRPKCAEVFAQRRWLLRHMVDSEPPMPAGAVSELVELELDVSEACGDRHGNNYHAWSHRAWVLTDLSPRSADPTKVLVSEWARSEAWTANHVSDGSGLHYRQLLQPRVAALLAATPGLPAVADLLASTAQRVSVYLDRPTPTLASALAVQVALAVSELCANADLLHRFEGHEALWAHRRATLAALKQLLQGRDAVAPDDELAAQVGVAAARVEAALVARCACATQPYQRSLAAQHVAWLRAVLRMPAEH